MFFRREKKKQLTFDDRVSLARDAGFTISSSGKTRASRGGLAADLSEGSEGHAEISVTGVLIGQEIGKLTDLGYQKIWMTPSGKKLAATAEQLTALHAFTEDLREALGMTSFYNEGLGSTNETHLYDRVKYRDAGTPEKPWLRSVR